MHIKSVIIHLVLTILWALSKYQAVCADVPNMIVLCCLYMYESRPFQSLLRVPFFQALNICLPSRHSEMGTSCIFSHKPLQAGMVACARCLIAAHSLLPDVRSCLYNATQGHVHPQKCHTMLRTSDISSWQAVALALLLLLLLPQKGTDR